MRANPHFTATQIHASIPRGLSIIFTTNHCQTYGPSFSGARINNNCQQVAAFGFAVAYFRERDRRRIANIYFRRHAAQMLMDISRHWGELYHLRNELMASSVDVEGLRKEYGADYARF